MALIRKPKVPLVRPGEKTATKPKEKTNSTEVPKASCLKATLGNDTQETAMTDPGTSADWQTIKTAKHHHQTQELTQKKEVKRVVPLLNAIVTKGKI